MAAPRAGDRRRPALKLKLHEAVVVRARTPAEVHAAGATAVRKRMAAFDHLIRATWSDDERARLTDERDALGGFGAGVEWLRTREWIGDGRGAA